MGFFSSLLKGIGTVAGAIINPGATIGGLLRGTAKTVTAPATAISATTAARTLADSVASPGVPLASGAGKLLVRVPKATESALEFARTGRTLVVSGGNGKVAKRTIVQTINLDTGQVVNEVTLEGAPFLMNKAVRELARTTRKLRKANRKIPTRTVKQSLGSQLTERVLNQTIQDVGDHHGHHGT